MSPAIFGSIFIQNENMAYSCGMHNLGLKDAVMAVADGEDPVDLLYRFNAYLLEENPSLEDGHTFSLDPEGPVYKVSAGDCEIFPRDDLFHNPFGRWRLDRVTG